MEWFSIQVISAAAKKVLYGLLYREAALQTVQRVLEQPAVKVSVVIAVVTTGCLVWQMWLRLYERNRFYFNLAGIAGMTFGAWKLVNF